nr:uncharacterized protein LOC109150784 [Ipomoea batatas]
MEGTSMPLRCSLCYNNNLVQIAGRVVEEFRAEQGDPNSEFSDGDDAFSGMENDKIREDEVFCNGKIRPIFPVHKRNLSTGFLKRNSNSSCMQAVKARLPLRKLLIEGRETEKLESDSDPGAEETFCVWEPKLGDDAGDGGGCTKKSSKWWKHLLSTPKRRYCRFT